MRAVMAAALHNRRSRNSGNFPEEISSLETDGLSAKVARRVVCHFLSGGTEEVGIEARFIANRTEEFAGVHDGCRHLFGRGTILQGDKCRMLSSHHHRTSWIDRNHLRAGFNKWQQDLKVGADLPAKRLQVPTFPCRHAAALQARDAPRVDAVPLEH